MRIRISAGDELTERPGRVQVLDHDRQRLLIAVFAAAELGDGRFVVGDAREMIAAKSLERDNLPVFERRDAHCQGGIGVDRLTPIIERTQARTTDRAGDRLCMKPAVSRVFVLGAADRTHGERRHCRALAVIGGIANDGETRAAVRAV